MRLSTLRIAVAVVANLVLGLMAAMPTSAMPYLTGISGGNIRGPVTNELHRRVSCAIDIPDSVVVLDIDFVPGRIIADVAIEHEVSGNSWWFRSEVWQFAPRDTIATSVTFADRTVLRSEESNFGESMAIYQYSVSCEDATAVYRSGWESGSTLLFDRQGNARPIDAASLARACGFRPDFVQPIAWVEENRRRRLVLRTSEYGGSNCQYLSYWLEDGTLEKVKPEELSGDLLRQLLDRTIDQR